MFDEFLFLVRNLEVSQGIFHNFLEYRSRNGAAIIAWMRLINIYYGCQARIISKSEPHKRGSILSTRVFPINGFPLRYCFPGPFTNALHFLANVTKPTLRTAHTDVIRQRALLAL